MTVVDLQAARAKRTAKNDGGGRQIGDEEVRKGKRLDENAEGLQKQKVAFLTQAWCAATDLIALTARYLASFVLMKFAPFQEKNIAALRSALTGRSDGFLLTHYALPAAARNALILKGYFFQSRGVCVFAPANMRLRDANSIRRFSRIH